MSEMTTAPALPKVKPDEKTRRQPPYNVVLLDDDDHSYPYVIQMLGELFAHPAERAYKMAKEVDDTGRVIVLTTHKEKAELGDWVAAGFCFALGAAAVKLFVVGKRMRVRTNHMRVNEGWTLAHAAVLDGTFHGRVTFQRLGAVTFFNVHTRIIREELGNISARGLAFDRDRDGVAVIFNVKQDRKFFSAGSIERFVEFAFAGRAFTGRDVHHIVGLVFDSIAERSFASLVVGFRKLFVIPRRFGGTDGVKELRAGW